MGDLRADYTELANAAAKCDQESERVRAITQQFQSQTESLRHSWIGRGADTFFAEMANQILPEFRRLDNALKQAGVSLKSVSQIFQTAEQEAAGYVRMTGQAGAGAGAGVGVEPVAPPVAVPGSGSPSPIPPPRVYIVNGINSDVAPGAVNTATNQMRDMLIGMGYAPDQVMGLPAAYNTNLQGQLHLEGTNFGGWLKPLDAVTNFGASVWNGAMYGVNSAVGVTQVLMEHVQGPNGQYTQDAYRYVLQDLQRNPLAPGQQIMLVGHSGGGAIMANLTPMLEARGYDVGQVVTMGSPFANYDRASQYAEVIGFRDQGDVFGIPYLRSDESRSILPLVPAALASQPTLPGVVKTVGGLFASDALLRDRNDNISTVTLNSGYSNPMEAHGSYWTSTDLVDILRQKVPAFNAGFATP